MSNPNFLFQCFCFVVATLAPFGGASALSTQYMSNDCQNLDNCPYSSNNTMSDYLPGSPVAISSELRDFMSTQNEIYLSKVTNMYPPSSGKVDSYDVFQGMGGRAFMYLRMYDRTGKIEHLHTARDYIEVALKGVNNVDPRYVGFLWGRTGVYCVGAVIATLLGEDKTASERIAKVQNIFDMSDDDSYAVYDDFDAGRAGLLYAATFLNTFYDRNDGDDSVITRSSIVKVAQAAVNRGVALSHEPELYLEWASPNDDGRWLGTSHGSAGVLVQLLNVPELLEEGTSSRDMIIKTLDHIVANQFPSGNFPSEYYDEEDDVLVQWDHGAPGVLGALIKAAGVLNDKKYLDSAHRAADCVWERGLLYKGLQMCHGIVGNTYMQIFMYKYTAEDKYMYRALQFQEFVRSMPELYDVNLMRYPTPNPYGFYIGSFESAIMLWSDLLAVSADEDFMKLSMPGYDERI